MRGPRRWLFAASGVYAALLVAAGGGARIGSDTGIFLSVAGRLLSGDRLYVEVIDNKDPLFFYTYAGALAAGDWRGPFLLDVVWLAVAAASTVLLLRAVGASRLTAGAGFVAYPLLLTSEAWSPGPGFSMLAGLAFVPLVGWLWIRGSFAAAGGFLCVALLFKLNLVLILASAPLAFILLGRLPERAGTQVARAAAGFFAVVGVAATVLAFRGELGGYIDVVLENAAYSGDVLDVPGSRGGILGHIDVVQELAGVRRFAFFGTAVLMVGLLAGWVLRSPRFDRRDTPDPMPIRTLAALALAAVVSTGATLGLTAIWSHHLQMLAYPALMLIAFLAMVAREARAFLPKLVVMGATATLVALSIGLLGSAGQRGFGESISSWFESAQSQTAESLERVAADRLPGLEEITFAHLGQNDEDAVGAFLDDRFVLACPEFAQYYWTPDLFAVPLCIRAERPCLLLVTPTFRAPRGTPPSGEALSGPKLARWEEFVANGSAVLRQEYERVLDHETRIGRTEIYMHQRPSACFAVRATREAADGIRTHDLLHGKQTL